MLKIGAFTFGGGYAMISLLQNEFVSRKKWLKEDEFLDVVAIAESTPGPIAINSSTYIGYRMAGFWGSFFATLAVCIPSFTIIFTISLFFDRFLKFTFVGNAFKGIQACVVYLILSAGIKMFKSLKKDLLGLVILGVTVLCMVLFSIFSVRFSAVFYILISGVIGLFAYLVRKAKKEDQP
ncbi:MAG: chromate transporter [Clostridia bacterium]|nr:chromate transporter [Clostridia bacterium]